MIDFLQNYLLFILAIGLIIWKGNYLFQNFIFKPLAGGNGVIQMDELTKANIVAMAWYAFLKQANRPDLAQDIFSNETFLFLFAALFAIAGLKHIKLPLNGKKGDHPPETENEK